MDFLTLDYLQNHFGYAIGAFLYLLSALILGSLLGSLFAILKNFSSIKSLISKKFKSKKKEEDNDFNFK